MEQVIRVDKRTLFERIFSTLFFQEKIEQILEFLLLRSKSFDDLVEKARQLGLALKSKIKNDRFCSYCWRELHFHTNAVKELEELVKILNKRYLSKTEKILDEL